MSRIPSTEPTELKESIENGERVTVVDVRQPHEFERNHIEASNVETVNVPLNQLQAIDPRKLLDDVSSEKVVAVCASGNRSGVATQLLNRAGIDAENLEYGMMGWQQVAS